MRFSSKVYPYLALVVAVLIPSSCLAQAGDWNVVDSSSSANQAIRVVLGDGKSYHGNFQSATETAHD